MMHCLKLVFVTFICLPLLSFAESAAKEEVHANKQLATSSPKSRFIPVELFTGAKWDGKHELSLKEASTTACATANGKQSPCDKYFIAGPFKTETNNTKIEWAGDKIPYYRRTFTNRAGEVESFFTINNSRDGLVRIYDKRQKWGVRTYDGLGSKFPLGYWKQGEVRTYNSKRPTRIEILELDGPDHCLTFRWTIGLGKRRNQDNIYTFCPDRGFTTFRYNNVDPDSAKKKANAKPKFEAKADAEIIKAYCSPADHLNWVVGEDECLRVITHITGDSASPDALVVYLHGDGYRGGPSDYLQHTASKIDKKNVAHVTLMRPGYYDSENHSSTGISNRKSKRGTNYNSHNVKEIALAIQKLKEYHKPNKTIVVGHSGGAAIAALILGRHPTITDGAILAACPCNVNKWVQMAGSKSGVGALSPQDYVEQIRPDASVIALTGTNDKNTFPVLAVEYIEKLKMTNINARYIAVDGETHGGVARSPEFYRAISEIL